MQVEYGHLIGESAAIRHVYHLVERSAPTDASVLITGESGTGKDLVAEAIHEASGRATGRFVAINCTAIPESLLERELFGHEQDAFTGAGEARPGCFELADRGTLFLDEIAEMPPNTQGNLLRVLQEKAVRRVGGSRERRINVRIIAATNRDPLQGVADGTLRADLYYRLNLIDIVVPPLRARRSDIPLLARAFLARAAETHGTATRDITPEALEALERHAWPGNVRELRNVIERVAILAATDPIDLEHLAPSLRQSPPGASRYELVPGMTIAEAEHRLIELTLERTANNKTRAARSLGITVKTLHNKLNRFRMRGPRHGEAAIADKTTTHDQRAASREPTPGSTRSPDP